MELIIEISDKMLDTFKKHGIMAFDYFNEYDKDQIAIAIAHGTPYNPSGDCISRSDLRKEVVGMMINKADDLEEVEFEINATLASVCEAIDNAQAISLPNEQIAWEQGYEAGLAQGKQDRPKGGAE